MPWQKHLENGHTHEWIVVEVVAEIVVADVAADAVTHLHIDWRIHTHTDESRTRHFTSATAVLLTSEWSNKQKRKRKTQNVNGNSRMCRYVATQRLCSLLTGDLIVCDARKHDESKNKSADNIEKEGMASIHTQIAHYAYKYTRAHAITNC